MSGENTNRYDSYFIELALQTAKLSYCTRLKVGAVAVRNRRVLCNGFNGTLPGMDNCCEEYITKVTEHGCITVGKTKAETEHAERNLISYAAREGIKLKGSSLFSTHAPCIECAKSIINAGFVEVVFLDFYKDKAGYEFLLKHKILVRQYEYTELV